MSSIYEERLQLLLTGYARDIDVAQIPEDIIHHCAIWMMDEPQILINKWSNSFSDFLLEIQLSGFASKVLNYQHIGKYQIFTQYIPYGFDDDDAIELEQVEEEIISHDISSVYDSHCIAFVERGRIKTGDFGDMKAKVIAFDKKGIMIGKTSWQIFEPAFVWSPAIGIQYNEEKVDGYFDESIDIDNKGFVSIQEWLIAMDKTGIVKQQNQAKNIFYLMCSINACEEKVVTRGMFRNFLCDTMYHFLNYKKDYVAFIKCFRQKIGFFM